MSNKIFSFILSAFLFFCATQVAHACSCVGSGSPCAQFQGSKAVFVGLVTSVTRDSIVEMLGERKISYSNYVVEFTVEEPLKGVATKTVEVVTGGGCAYSFETGERYLVYARQEELPTSINGVPITLVSGGFSLSIPLSTMMCTRTRPLKQAVDDLELIRALNAGKPETRIFGSVIDYTRQPSDPSPYNERPMAGVTVKAENENNRYEAQTDKDGRYQFRNIKPGVYKVTVVLPEGYKLPHPGIYYTANISSTCGAEAIFYVHKGPIRF